MTSPTTSEPAETVDLAVVGAGAAGLFAAVWAARAAPGARVVAFDGARTLGAKILVAGGGRCNVTHHAVNERDYHGSSQPAIRNILRRFSVDDTVAFFRELGVELKREETGKLFPTTDSARTVLAALLRAADTARAEVRHPWRIDTIVPDTSGGFLLNSANHPVVRAARVILAAGGKSLPKSGSDGAGERLARSLGLPITRRVFPALVPLTMDTEHFLCALSGVAFPAQVRVHAGTGKVLASTTGAVLCTHFGLSGPAILDISRSLLDAHLDDPGAHLRLAALPGVTPEALDRELTDLGKRPPLAYLKSRGLPERLAVALCSLAGVAPLEPAASVRREARRALGRALTDLTVPAIDPRGWNYAEVTAGGVPLSALHLKTMEARDVGGLHLCGEVCDVDGRIGGFNFQGAWAGGYIAGTSAAQAFTGAGSAV